MTDVKASVFLVIAVIAFVALCLSALILYGLLWRLGDTGGSQFFGWITLGSGLLTAVSSAALSLSRSR